MESALETCLRSIERFVKTIKSNFKGIVKSIKTGITNAIVEGLKSKIQMTKSRARGY